MTKTSLPRSSDGVGAVEISVEFFTVGSSCTAGMISRFPAKIMLNVEPRPTSLVTSMWKPMSLAERLRNRQAEARAAVFARGGGVGLLEGFENHAEVLLGNADAGVNDLNPHRLMIGRIGHDAHGDAALLGELERVADEINNDLPQFFSVGLNGRHRCRQVGEQLHRPVAHQPFLLRDGVADKNVQRDRRKLQLDFARLDF